MIQVLSYIFGVTAIVATLLPLINHTAWWIRIFDFPRLQIIFSGAVAIILFIIFPGEFDSWFPVTLVLIFATLIFQVSAILPYSPFFEEQVERETEVKEKNRLRLVVCNVYMDNRNSKKCLEEIKKANPDIFVAVETNKWWKQVLEPLKKDLSYTVFYPQDNTYGILLFSKFPLINPKVQFLVEKDVPSIHTDLEFSNGKKITLHCLHPKPPGPGHNKESTKRDAELLVVGRDAKKSSNPTIVCGDLNDVAWSHTTKLFQKTSNLLDPRIGRGMFNTFHAKVPFFRWPLDHIFHSSHFKLVKLKRLNKIGSDHFPIFIELSYAPDNDHEGPTVTVEERKNIDKRINKVEGEVKKPKTGSGET